MGWAARAAAVLAVLGLIGASIAVLQGGQGAVPVTGTDPRVDGMLTAADLAGRTFVVAAVEVDGTPLSLAAEPPSLAFGDRSLRLGTGCNAVEGSFEVADGTLRASGGPVDRQGCVGTVAAQEQALLGLLLDQDPTAAGERQPPTAHLAGDLLQLQRGDVAAWAVDVTEQAAVAGLWREPAAEVVSRLLTAISAQRWEAALQHWDGYPGAVGDPAGARADLERLAREHPWLLGRPSAPETTAGVTPSAVPDAWELVTVVSEPDAAGARHAGAFLVRTRDREQVVRIPDAPLERLSPAPGATVAPGDRIVLLDTPIEGGATAHVNGVEVPTEIRNAPTLEGRSTTITVPAWARGDIVVTLSLATPEAPTADAAWYRVER